MSEQGEIGYEAALLQFRPVISAEERINVGILLYSPTTGHVVGRVSTRYRRARALFPDLNGALYRRMIRRLDARIRNLRGTSRSDQGSLFLVRGNTRTAIQSLLREVIPSEGNNFTWSSVRSGICTDLEARADELLQEFVVRFERISGRQRVEDEDVWDSVKKAPPFGRIAHVLRESVTLSTPDYSYTFTAGWKNGRVQVVEPVSLDYQEPRDMLEEANRWRGRLAELARTNEFGVTLVLSESPTEPTAGERYAQAVAILRRSNNLREVFTTSRAAEFVDLVESDLLRSSGGFLETGLDMNR